MAKVHDAGETSPFLHPGAADALVLASRPLEEGPRPVAVVLEDGTVRALEAKPSRRGHVRGLLAGRDWTFWWERRSWAGA